MFAGSWFWSTRRIAFAWFRRSDHVGDPAKTLDEFIRHTVQQSGRPRPEGRIFILTNLRYFGFVFNPVSFYFCFDKNEQLQTMVAEVTNTPWGQTHCYVVDRNQLLDASKIEAEMSEVAVTERINQNDGLKNGELGPSTNERSLLTKKVFHVSPFLSMDYAYQWFLRIADDRLTLHMENIPNNAGKPIFVTENCPIDTQVSETESIKAAKRAKKERHRSYFNVTLSLAKQKIDRWNRGKVLICYPLMTLKILVAIYWQAFRLWRLGIPFFLHPDKKR